MSPLRYWQRGGALSLIAAPLLILVSNTMGLNQVGSDRSTLDWVSVHPGRYLLAVSVFLLGLALLIPAGLRMATAVTARGATLAKIGGTLFLIGSAASLVTNSTYLLSARLLTLPGVDRKSALVVKEIGDEDGGLGIYLLVGVLFFVGLILLAIALQRDGRVPTWAAGLIILGTLATLAVDLLGASTVLTLTAQVVLLVGLSYVGLTDPALRASGERPPASLAAPLAGERSV